MGRPALRVPAIKVVQMHTCAVRLCALVYFFAFLGNVVDGPVMWLTLPPTSGWDAEGLVSVNRYALLTATIAFLRPWSWPCMIMCWHAWYISHTHGHWFRFGWDQMMDEIGFLSFLLSITLGLYDDQAPPDEDDAPPLSSSPLSLGGGLGGGLGTLEEEPLVGTSAMPAGGGHGASSALRSRGGGASASGGRGSASQEEEQERDAAKRCTQVSTFFGPAWRMLWGISQLNALPPPVKRRYLLEAHKCGFLVEWSRTAVELSLTLAAFRLFLAAGLLKFRIGSRCWKDHTCLYDHFETQPMPNPVAWFMHNWAPLWLKRVMQWFAIDLAERLVPFLLLSFLLSMGPLGLLHWRLKRTAPPWAAYILAFPGRLVGGAIIMTFVLGMFLTGNYAFLHPLCVVALIASIGTDRGAPVVFTSGGADGGFYDFCRAWYRRLAALVVIALAVFAFLPSLPAYAWLAYGSVDASPFANSVADHWLAEKAADMNLGIAYNRHAYFAGAVHQRREMVLFADVGGNKLVELEIPCKVGATNRAPCFTSPLHRRFAWQWWFLALGSDPTFLQVFLNKLCAGDLKAWRAIEPGAIDPEFWGKVKRFEVHMYEYHFSRPGDAGEWWTRERLGGPYSTFLSQKCSTPSLRWTAVEPW